MQFGTFKFKIGSAGKRNRANHRRDARRLAYHVARGHNRFQNLREHFPLPDDLCNEDFGLAGTKLGVLNIPAIIQKVKLAELDLSGTWNEKIARMALDLFKKSGKSQKEFAEQHGFSDSKLRSWKKKLETSAW